MKNFVKKGLITLGTIFALLGVGGTVAFASGYITWGGSNNYNKAMANLGLIQERIEESDSSNKKLTDEVSKLTNELAESKNKYTSLESSIKSEISNLHSKVTSANGKGNRYDVFAEELSKYSKQLGLDYNFNDGLGNNNTKSQLEQAEKDMERILLETEEILNSTSE